VVIINPVNLEINVYYKTVIVTFMGFVISVQRLINLII